MPLIVKNIVLAGFGNITLLDLDTIDLSNLNRQFLFRKKDIKQSKAMVSAPLPLPMSYRLPKRTIGCSEDSIGVQPQRAHTPYPRQHQGVTV